MSPQRDSWQCWRKVFTGACYASIMSIQITSSIVAPIFAIAGPEFGLSTVEIAQIFSVYYLPNVGSSLAAGVLASLFGRRRVLLVGCTVLSAGCIALGLVPGACASAGTPDTGTGDVLLVERHTASAASTSCMYSLFVGSRVLQGIGVALSQTCLFAMLADMWPEDTGKVMGAAELAGGLAYALGPPTGGFLFQSGGFVMPFVIQGCLPLFFVLVLQLALSKLNSVTDVSVELEQQELVARERTADGDDTRNIKAAEGNMSASLSRRTSSETKNRDDGVPATGQQSDDEAAGLVSPDAADSDTDDEAQKRLAGYDEGTVGLMRMWRRLFTPGLLLTGITTAMEQGAWGHYQLSNPPFLVQFFDFGPVRALSHRLLLLLPCRTQTAFRHNGTAGRTVAVCAVVKQSMGGCRWP